MYRRFGSKVTVIQRDARLIPREDEDVSQAIREILEERGDPDPDRRRRDPGREPRRQGRPQGRHRPTR